MESDIVASPTGGSQGSPIEVVTPPPIRNDRRGFQSAPATPSSSFIDIKQQLERTKAEHRTAPPTPLASKTPWNSDLETTLTTGDSFSATKRKYEQNRWASDSGPSPDGSSPQKYKETPVPPPQSRFYNSARYETHTAKLHADADLTSDDSPLPKRMHTERPFWKPRPENTIAYNLVAPNPVPPPAREPALNGSPPQRYKETPVPPLQPKIHNSARYEAHAANLCSSDKHILETRMYNADLTSDETPQPKRPRTALPSWEPRTDNTIPYNLLVSNTLHPANHVPPPTPAPKRRPGRPRNIVIPKEKTPPPPAPTNPFTPKSMRIRALERDLRLSRDEAEMWRMGNEGAIEMWRTVHFEAEILRRKFRGLGGERAWQEVVWSGSTAAAGVAGEGAVEAREGAVETREGEVDARASKEMAFVVD